MTDSGNMWQLKYQEAHRELVVANRAVQRLSARCKALRKVNERLREPIDAKNTETLQIAFDDAMAAYQRKCITIIEPTLPFGQSPIKILNPNMHGAPKP